MRRSLILTADDFGMSVEVNEAVETAHREGVLTCASLLVTGSAVEDAVRRARGMPRLGVGLHLALVAAPPASPPETIPALMHADGSGLGERPMLTGAWMAVSRKVQAQVEREVRAQLDLYRRSGLALDHVDGHWHAHQHPFVHRLLARFASEFGIRAVRVPREPPLASWRAADRQALRRRVTDAAAHRLILTDMRRSLRRAGIAHNDWFFGKSDGGDMNLQRLLGVVRHLPPGVSEAGLHPATGRWSGPHAPPAGWRAEAELAALVDPALAEACRADDVGLIRFSDLPTAA